MSKKEFVIKQLFESFDNIPEDIGYYCEDKEHFDNIPEDIGYYCEDKEHFGIKWSILIKKRHGHFQAFLVTNLTKSQSISVEFTIRIFSKNRETCLERSNANVFGNFNNELHNDWGWKRFLDWETFEKKYLNDGNLDLEVDVKILKTQDKLEKKVHFEEKSGTDLEIEEEEQIIVETEKETENVGNEKKIRRNFEEKQFSDVALVIGEQKFYVSKLFLSSQSPYFANLFSENSGKSEIKLSNSNPQNFQYFLELLYGEPGPDEETVEGILSIADLYNTPTIIKKCEEYLLEKSTKSLKDKLEMAGKYQLDALRKSCVSRIRTVSDIRLVALKNPREMDHLILAALFQKVLTLV
ncbi:hypothetical protein L3Y34_019194 [Caenorhabditis briggsae]|uniref:BTB domain-containing protein n=1 Tax=Caenorhabditis briggsae TaxID=6238 RepID=A0AAE9DNE6_CAEBR|nr:hypothetical protein L3Y34_019194 [Caenorhabditis briggsae]